jgi:hypothetical protein
MKRKGFTIVEAVLATAVASIFMLFVAQWLRSGGALFASHLSRRQLQLEGANACELMTGLLRQADARSITLANSAGAPWARLAFASGGHHYLFYASEGKLLFVADHQNPKPLITHLRSAQFSLERPFAPALLHYAFTLEPSRRPRPGDTVRFSGFLFLEAGGE